MNISSDISSINGSHSSDHFYSNGTEVDIDLKVLSYGFFACILLSCPINFYVIWLIVTGTGNGLAAEFFNLNLSVCEILLCVDSFLIFLIYSFQFYWVFIYVSFFDGVVISGRPLFECLICVERYLAVVHPVTFLKYKPLRYRLMCSAVVWLAVFAIGGFNTTISYFWYLPYLTELFFIFFSIQLFCCLAVLRALKQSGPGERGREREEDNNMKRRAFYFILITTVTTIVLYTPYTVLLGLPATRQNDTYLSMGEFCYNLAGLVQPVFFLYRVGKLNFIKCK